MTQLWISGLDIRHLSDVRLVCEVYFVYCGQKNELAKTKLAVWCKYVRIY